MQLKFEDKVQKLTTAVDLNQLPGKGKTQK